MNSSRIFSNRGAWVYASLLPLAVTSQTQSSFAANPKATVPSVEYRSVLRGTSLGIERDKLDWRKAMMMSASSHFWLLLSAYDIDPGIMT